MRRGRVGTRGSRGLGDTPALDKGLIRVVVHGPGVGEIINMDTAFVACGRGRE